MVNIEHPRNESDIMEEMDNCSQGYLKVKKVKKEESVKKKMKSVTT